MPKVIKFPNGSSYEGELKDEMYHGNGKYIFPDGSFYEGEFLENKFDGFGKLIHVNGEIYEGLFEEDNYNGFGHYFYSNGDVYFGNWLNGKRNGEGKMEYKNGDIYEGNWLDDEQNGFGKYFYISGSIYEGNWINGKKNGFGKLKYSTGNLYDGEWADGKYNGFGKLVNLDGSKYEGFWIKQQKNGFGRYTCLNGDILEGDYINGELNGFGKHISAKGIVIYEGGFIKNKRNGYGKSISFFGGTYEGHWLNGEKNGFGKSIQKNGEEFIGEFINGVKQENTNNLISKSQSIIEEELKSKIYYLFFDTETTGLPKNWKAPVTDFNNWPRLVQLAYILYDEDGNKIEENDFIIKPDGFSIPKEASKVHGITTEIAIEEGYSIDYVLGIFHELIQKSEYLVAHNIAFDEKIMGCEFLRNDYENLINNKKKICTMEKTTNFCKLDGPYGYKWPKLSELYQKLFGYVFDEAHDASVDIKATAKCFWELRDRKIL